eukprot:TRINITY_DN4150_c0_g1_i1.p1 TRINITY_DN4150_c0_g1~~TRINITY_DN4150_c0_g1_i1.p1  ORF type:complete len:231 (-),score=71.51 TRINITY_DN4150_c0_g1_i1:50-682(-)
MAAPSPKKTSGVLDRLTDTSKYTGSHKERFDAEGKGKGKSGRMDLVPDDGYVASFREKKDTPAAAGEKKEKKEKSDILSRLTDPKLYTGAHKSRFDADGKGLGVNQTIDKDVPRDLSDMTRPALHAAPRAKASPSSSSPSSAGASSSSPAKPKTTKAAKSEILDRLTDPKLYTGAHKHRFDDDGKGKGKDGRVDRSKHTGYVQGSKISDS